MPSRAASVQIRMRSGSLAGIGVEGALDRLAPISAGRAGEDADPLLDAIRFVERLEQPSLQPAPRVLPFGEKDQAPIDSTPCRRHVGCGSSPPARHPRIRAAWRVARRQPASRRPPPVPPAGRLCALRPRLADLPLRQSRPHPQSSWPRPRLRGIELEPRPDRLSPVTNAVAAATGAAVSPPSIIRCKALPVHFEGAREGGDRGQQPLLQANEGQLRHARLLRRQSADPFARSSP